MSRSHLNLLEVGTIKERSNGYGIAIPSTIVSDITMGSTQAIKTNNLQVSDGSYISLYNSLVQTSGFIALTNLTTDNLNENNSGQGINVTCNMGITGDKILSVNTIEPNGSTGMAIGVTGGIVSVNGTLKVDTLL